MTAIKFLIATALIVLCSTNSASAIDFTKPLLNEDGVAFTVCLKYDPAVGQQVRCIEETSLTLGRMVFEALNVAEASTPPDAIVARGLLALKVRDAKDLDLDDKQRDLIKTALFAAAQKLGYKPVVIVQALRVIDPASVKER